MNSLICSSISELLHTLALLEVLQLVPSRLVTSLYQEVAHKGILDQTHPEGSLPGAKFWPLHPRINIWT